ncbi:MAG: sensor histidine kinase [Deltaproteobacteria bacterium]|nr:sensor histidine kinase [Deltaproteobacteria bacterium]
MPKKEILHDLLVHDLGGPLSILTTDIGNLLAKQEKYGHLTEEQKRVLERALRNAKKAQTLLSEMIEALKSEEGRFDGSYFSVAETLKETLKEVLDVYAPDVSDKLIKCETDEDFKKRLEEAFIYVNINGRYAKEDFFHDRAKVIHIMRNLFSNALKYRKKRVDISVFGNDELIISVEDDGPGIPPEKKENIFKRFMHIGTKKAQGVEGLGFGLSCVKAILDRIRGEIKIQSEEGRGTRFIVRIPPLK